MKRHFHTYQPVKPWPWADTWPVGRLVVPRLNINQIILANASGQSLAFGPGMVGNEWFSTNKRESLTLSGHRDTHFSFVQELQIGDTMSVQTLPGKWNSFIVEKVEVRDSRIERLKTNQETGDLQLTTSYPFETLVRGEPLRYTVTAKLIVQASSFQRTASTIAGGEHIIVSSKKFSFEEKSMYSAHAK